MKIKNGFIAVVKEDCPTCQLVVPVLAQMADEPVEMLVYTQAELAFLAPVPAGEGVQLIHDISANGLGWRVALARWGAVIALMRRLGER